jgi:hypothetical protein
VDGLGQGTPLLVELKLVLTELPPHRLARCVCVCVLSQSGSRGLEMKYRIFPHLHVRLARCGFVRRCLHGG